MVPSLLSYSHLSAFSEFSFTSFLRFPSDISSFFNLISSFLLLLLSLSLLYFSSPKQLLTSSYRTFGWIVEKDQFNLSFLEGKEDGLKGSQNGDEGGE